MKSRKDTYPIAKEDIDRFEGSQWVLIDASFLLHRAMHALGGLSHEDLPTGAIFGFFEQLRTICADPVVKSAKVAVFADSRKSFRKNLFEDYKKKRHEDRSVEEMIALKILHKQGDLLLDKILPGCGFPVYRQNGLESDDLIAYTAKLLTRNRRPGIMITGDGDLYQCISRYVTWYDPQRQVHMTQEEFVSRKGILPNAWGAVKALAGCPSDNVPGIQGVGEATAIKFILNSLPEKYKAYQSIVSKSGRKVFKRNQELVVLPHPRTKDFALKLPDYRPDRFFKMCKKLGIVSFLEGSKHKQWRRFFTGKMQEKVRMRNA